MNLTTSQKIQLLEIALNFKPKTIEDLNNAYQEILSILDSAV